MDVISKKTIQNLSENSNKNPDNDKAKEQTIDSQSILLNIATQDIDNKNSEGLNQINDKEKVETTPNEINDKITIIEIPNESTNSKFNEPRNEDKIEDDITSSSKKIAKDEINSKNDNDYRLAYDKVSSNSEEQKKKLSEDKFMANPYGLEDYFNYYFNKESTKNSNETILIQGQTMRNSTYLILRGLQDKFCGVSSNSSSFSSGSFLNSKFSQFNSFNLQSYNQNPSLNEGYFNQNDKASTYSLNQTKIKANSQTTNDLSSSNGNKNKIITNNNLIFNSNPIPQLNSLPNKPNYFQHGFGFNHTNIPNNNNINFNSITPQVSNFNTNNIPNLNGLQNMNLVPPNSFNNVGNYNFNMPNPNSNLHSTNFSNFNNVLGTNQNNQNINLMNSMNNINQINFINNVPYNGKLSGSTNFSGQTNTGQNKLSLNRTNKDNQKGNVQNLVNVKTGFPATTNQTGAKLNHTIEG